MPSRSLLEQLCELEVERCALKAWWYEERAKEFRANPSRLIEVSEESELSRLGRVLHSIQRQIDVLRAMEREALHGESVEIGHDAYIARLSRIRNELEHVRDRKGRLEGL